MKTSHFPFVEVKILQRKKCRCLSKETEGPCTMLLLPSKGPVEGIFLVSWGMLSDFWSILSGLLYYFEWTLKRSKNENIWHLKCSTENFLSWRSCLCHTPISSTYRFRTLSFEIFFQTRDNRPLHNPFSSWMHLLNLPRGHKGNLSYQGGGIEEILKVFFFKE